MSTIILDLPDGPLNCPLKHCGKRISHVLPYPFEEGSCYVECAGGHQFVVTQQDANIENKPVGDPVKCSEGSKGGES
jgi:hypothetical protein